MKPNTPQGLFIFKCRVCGKELYRDNRTRIWSGKVRYLEHIIDRVGGKCKFCGHRLQIPPVHVTVSIREKTTK